ncbi:hypothetical protein DFQ26_001727 [Actinomortierella ambigua]|nr:hypothetical protein DFQ26_001727 [Actinomortierella ambigua]
MLAANTIHTSKGASPTSANSDIADLEALAIRIRALERVLVANASPTGRPSVSEANYLTTATTASSSSATLTLANPENTEGGPDDSNNNNNNGNDSNNNPTSPTAALATVAVGLRASALAKNGSALTPGSLSRRIQKMETLLQNATRERKTIEQFLLKYEGSKLAPTPGSSHPDRELLTLQAKTELIMAAQGELEVLAEHAKTIQSLQSCAELGGLKNLEPEYPALAKLSTVHVEQSENQEEVAYKVNRVMEDYNALIQTVSEIFLLWDSLLTAAEGKVTEVERQQRA